MTDTTEITRRNRRVLWALLALTLATVLLALVDLGRLHIAVALGIAVAKALLVVLVFMELRHASGLVWIVAGGGFFWLGILIVLTLSDVLARGTIPPIPGK